MDSLQLNLKELSLLLARVEDPELIRGFLESLLTPREIQDLAGRWELVKLLDEGWTQRAIASRLGMSLCKITRGARELRRPDAPFYRMLALKKTIEPEAGPRDRG